jgi:hypothetical protein
MIVRINEQGAARFKGELARLSYTQKIYWDRFKSNPNESSWKRRAVEIREEMKAMRKAYNILTNMPDSYPIAD